MNITGQQVEEFVDTCSRAKTINALVKDGALAFKAMGLSFMYYHYIPHLGAHDYNVKKIAHIPKEHRAWITEEFPDFLSVSPRDPFESYVLKNGEIEWIHDLKTHDDFQSSQVKAFLGVMLDRFGHSFIVPAFGPRRSRGYFFLPLSHVLQKPGIQDIAYLGFVCSFYHRTYNKLCGVIRQRLSLTQREHEVLQLIAMGLSNAEIGKILEISTNTVSGYVKQIFLKMDVADRLSASLRAFALDLID